MSNNTFRGQGPVAMWLNTSENCSLVNTITKEFNAAFASIYLNGSNHTTVVAGANAAGVGTGSGNYVLDSGDGNVVVGALSAKGEGPKIDSNFKDKFNKRHDPHTNQG